MRVTAKEIARACGVSQPTVSLILNNKGDRYTPETRKRVLAAAQRLGYLPNAYARAIATGQTNSIGLLTSTQPHLSIVQQMMPGIQEALREHNLHLTVTELPDEKLCSEGFVPRILREYAVNGFLVGYTHGFPPQMKELIEKFRIPSIWLNHKRAYDAVYPDDLAAGRLLTERLIQAGHCRIAYVTYTNTPHYSQTDRYDGYAEAMRAAGLPPLDYRASQPLAVDEVNAFTQSWLDVPDRPTAVVTYNYRDAGNTLVAALERGMAVPRDLSIVTVHDMRYRLGGYQFEMAQVPGAAIGRRATQMLLAKVEQPSELQPSVVAAFDFLPGNTVAPPR